MSKEEKSKSPFTSGGVFVDIFIGFLIAACIAGIIYRCFIYNPNAVQDDGKSYMVYFEIENAHESYVDYLENEDTVYDTQTGLKIGALDVHDGSEQGKAVSISAPQTEEQGITVMGVLRSRPGVMAQGSLVLDGTYTLTPGQVLDIYTDTVAVTVRVIRITEEQETPVIEEPANTQDGTEQQTLADSE